MKVIQSTDARANAAGLFTSTMRLAIVEQLLGGSAIVGELANALGAEQAVVSKQLGILREAGIITCEPRGRCRIYALAHRQRIRSLVDALGAVAELRSAGTASHAHLASKGVHPARMKSQRR